MPYKTAHRLAAGIAIVGSLMLAWLSLGVGIIGADGDPANVMYFGVIAIGLAGALFARGRPHGMARVLVAMAGGILVVMLIALVAPLGRPYSGPLELIGLNGFFVALFLGAAWLFDRSARTRSAGEPA